MDFVCSSSDVIESLESCLADYVPLIQSAMENDKDLANSKVCLMFIISGFGFRSL